MDDWVKHGLSCNIVVTQPRRIAATSLANRVIFIPFTNVFFNLKQVGLDTSVSAQDTILTYMTTGILLRKLISAKSLKHFTHLVIDEVHERDLETDLILLLIKKMIQEDPHGRTKIILMSTTIDSSKFIKYFTLLASSESNDYESIVPSIIKIKTKSPTYFVQELFLESIISDPVIFIR